MKDKQLELLQKPQKQKRKSKSRKRAKGRAGRNYFRKWLKHRPYNYYQVASIVDKYSKWQKKWRYSINHSRKRTKPHHIQRTSKRTIQRALDEMVNHQHGKDDRSINRIARDNGIGRSTLYKYYKKWKRNPYRASRTPLTTDHIPNT